MASLDTYKVSAPDSSFANLGIRFNIAKIKLVDHLVRGGRKKVFLLK